MPLLTPLPLFALLQSKGATYSDEDIDALLKKGEERTDEMNTKLQTDVQHNLATFSVMGDVEEAGSLYNFGGVDHKGGGGGGGMMINLGQRERKARVEVSGRGAKRRATVPPSYITNNLLLVASFLAAPCRSMALPESQ